MGKPVTWLVEPFKTPPFTRAARLEAGFRLRRLQEGFAPRMPHSRPMPVIGFRCHELRVKDVAAEWRIIYRLDADTILIAGIFDKKSRRTPDAEIEMARKRLRRYDNECS